MDWKLEVVVVPVADVDRAKRFYSEQCGFVVDVDHQAGETITIGTGLAAMAPGSLQGLQLVVSDIEAARAELAVRGVAVSEVQHFDDGVQTTGPGGNWNSFVFFSDPDGNGWTVQQKPAGD